MSKTLLGNWFEDQTGRDLLDRYSQNILTNDCTNRYISTTHAAFALDENRRQQTITAVHQSRMQPTPTQLAETPRHLIFSQTNGNVELDKAKEKHFTSTYDQAWGQIGRLRGNPNGLLSKVDTTPKNISHLNKEFVFSTIAPDHTTTIKQTRVDALEAAGTAAQFCTTTREAYQNVKKMNTSEQNQHQTEKTCVADAVTHEPNFRHRNGDCMSSWDATYRNLNLRDSH